jgi:N-methylhydantoinase A
VVRALDRDEARGLLARIAPDLDAVAICFLHAYANPAHEALLARMIRAEYPRLFVSVSHEVLPEIREYERTSTTVVNAYVGPLVADYLTALRARLAGIGVQARLLMMQSSGGTADARQVIAQPVQVIESGPAAGVVGAARVAAAAGIPDVITFDMGGTTAKASLIEGGAVFSTDEYEVGGGISLSSRLVKGGGYAVKLPVIDVSEVGAGGGSIVRVDASGVLKLGPDSAGATPGPACYGRGGALPTVTDASVVLGYLNPQALAGGTVPIDAAKAWAAYDGLVAPALGCSGLEAAYGVHRVANAVMMRAIKAVSTYRGRDPRDFSLFAFGGNGGIHAVALARELQMRQVVVPAGAGVFSALGLLFADFEVMRSAAFLRPAAGVAPAELNARFAALQLQVEGELGAAQAARILWRAEMRYAGQAFELPVSLPARPLTDLDMEQLRERFAAEHARFYGYRLDGARIDFVALRVLGGVAPILPAMAPAAPLAQPGRARRRQAYFGREIGAVATDILARIDLDQGWRAGPAIIEDEDGTVVVPPGARIRRDAAGNLVIAP